MDLHLIPGAAADADERAAVDALLGPPNSPWEGGSRAVGVEGNVARGGREARARRNAGLRPGGGRESA